MHLFRTLRILAATAGAMTCPCAGGAPSSVEISFIAVPQGGAPGHELSAADLKLSEDGKTQAIVGLQKITSEKAPWSLPAHTFSNRTGVEKAPGVNVIFLDGVNTRWRNDTSAREETTRALKRIKPEECAAILIFGKTLRVLSDFSDTPALREEKVKEFGTGKDGLAPTYSDLILPANLTGRAEMYQEQQRLERTYSALQSIASMVTAVPGRKNLLWISGDFPLLLGRPVEGDLRPTDADSDVQRIGKMGYNKAADDLLRSLNFAGVSVYPVDARNVSLDPQSRDSHVNAITTSSAGEGGTINDIMKHLAEQTGGAVFSGRKELGDDLRGALDDARNAYVISFVPGRQDDDKTPHKLKLQSRTKDYQIRIRPTYYLPAAPADPNARLVRTLSAPLDLPGIGLTAHVEPDAADASSLRVSLDIDSRDIQLTQQGDNWTGAIGLGIFQGNSGGEQFGRQMQTGGVTIHKPDYESAIKNGTGIHFDFKLKREPKATFLRFGVIDQKIPKSGSLSVSL